MAKAKFSFPLQVLQPIKDFLVDKQMKLLKRKQALTREDPFSDPARVDDNAALDADAAEISGHDRVSALKWEVDKMLIEIRKALTRMKLGKYGLCDKCGEMIDTDRLAIDPTIELCVGCGKKNNLQYYGFDGAPTAALDINHAFLESRKDGVSTSYLQADGCSLPFKSSAADQVFAVHYLEHVESYDDALDELTRVTKEGGTLTIAVPHPNYEGVMARMDSDYHSPRMHRRVLDEKELRDGLESRNFEIVESAKRDSVQAIMTTAMFFLHRKNIQHTIRH